MQNRIYVSAPFFNNIQLKKVRLVEHALKDNPTVDYVFSPRKLSIQEYKMFTPEWFHACYRVDLKHLLSCNALIIIMDYDNQDTDSGSAFEFAYAKANHIFCTTIKFDNSPVNLMLGQASDYHFKNLSDLEHYDFNKKKKNSWNIKMH